MKKITKAVIPVAGLGTRFLPITKSVPKEMRTLQAGLRVVWNGIVFHRTAKFGKPAI